MPYRRRPVYYSVSQLWPPRTERSMQMSPLLDKADVADLLKVSVRTVDRLRESGDLRAVRVRGRVLFSPQDVQAFLDAHGEGGRS